MRSRRKIRRRRRRKTRKERLKSWGLIIRVRR